MSALAGGVSAMAHWLAVGVLDGTLLAFAAWILAVTLLRRSSGQVLSRLWLVALLGFIVVRPFAMHALPLRSSLAPALETGVTSPAPVGAPWIVAACLYLGVVGLLAARLGMRHRQLRRRVAAYAPAGAALRDRVAAAAGRLSLRRLPEVRITDAPAGPFTIGPLRPVLVLPRWVCGPGARLDAVLLHELSHLKRRDHVTLCLERLVGTLFFFWPPVRWVSRQLDAARELACDERAIQHGGFSPADYGRHLVAVLSVARQHAPAAGALGMGLSRCRLERRIDRLLQDSWSRRPRWLEAAALGLLVVCALLGLRPARARPAVPRAALGSPAAAVVPDRPEPNMCVDTSAARPCVLQGCGTQCAP